MAKEIIESKPLTLAEVKSTLTKRGKKAELSYIQRVTLDHTVKFSSLPARTAKSLVTKLKNKYEMEEPLAIQLVDIAPTTADELASFLARAPRTYTPDEVSDILELLISSMKKEAAKKKK
ncbi:MAG: RNA polymerase Rpb4 family protein [Candidatus Hermodarchaeia archaeon]|jgi:DNA-directed RNA polymerase subunit F